MNPLVALISLFGMFAGFRLGRYVRKLENDLELRDVGHQCEPHHCNIRAISCVCLQRPDGEFWVKEYGNDIQREGRTYQVNYCPWCGVKAKKTIY